MSREQLQPLQEHDKEEWRQFLLAQLIGFLEQNRDQILKDYENCLLYTSPSPRDGLLSRMPSSA